MSTSRWGTTNFVSGITKTSIYYDMFCLGALYAHITMANHRLSVGFFLYCARWRAMKFCRRRPHVSLDDLTR